MPVRVGAPSSSLPIAGLPRQLQSPTYATSVGLLLWGLHEDARAVHRRFESGRHDNAAGSGQGKWMGQAVKWLKNLLPDQN
jgi:cell division ATPase FtsA